MIDIKFLRENPEAVKENIRKKFQDSKLPMVDEVIELDAESRKTQQEADDLRANRNKISKEIGALTASLLTSAMAFFVWWSSATLGLGTRMTGFPMRQNSLMELAPARLMTRSAAL